MLSRYKRSEKTTLPVYTQLTPAKLTIVEAVGRLTYLTAHQATQLLYSPGSKTRVMDLLKDLFHQGYLHRLFVYQKLGQGSPRAVYCLDVKGLAALRQLGKAPEGRIRLSEQRNRDMLFLPHTLATIDLLIAFHRLPKLHAQIEVIRFLTEKDLKRVRMGESVKVIPDGWIQMNFFGRELTFWLEADLGTEERYQMRTRIAGIVQAQQGSYQRTLGTDVCNVLFVVFADEKAENRATKIRQWIEEELTDLGQQHQADLFRVAALKPADDPPERLFAAIWHVPFKDDRYPLLTGGIS